MSTGSALGELGLRRRLAPCNKSNEALAEFAYATARVFVRRGFDVLVTQPTARFPTCRVDPYMASSFHLARVHKLS